MQVTCPASHRLFELLLLPWRYEAHHNLSGYYSHHSAAPLALAESSDVSLCAQAEVETKYAAPKELHGFELVREHFVQEYDSQVLMYRHKKTGKHLPAACASSCRPFPHRNLLNLLCLRVLKRLMIDLC